MAVDAHAQVPVRRTAGLVVRVQGDETLVLDTLTDTAHCLPADVARVWEACTAERSLAQVADAAGVSAEVAEASVEQLLDSSLLDVPKGIDRRKFLRRSVLVGAGAVAVPVIQSVVAPSMAAAASTLTVTSVSPNSVANGACTGVVITGTGFVVGHTYTVTLTNGTNPGGTAGTVTATSVTATSTTSLSATFCASGYSSPGSSHKTFPLSVTVTDVTSSISGTSGAAAFNVTT